jgi:hypothetical protein
MGSIKREIDLYHTRRCPHWGQKLLIGAEAVAASGAEVRECVRKPPAPQPHQTDNS